MLNEAGIQKQTYSERDVTTFKRCKELTWERESSGRIVAAGVMERSFGVVERGAFSKRFGGNPCFTSFTVDTRGGGLDVSSAEVVGSILAASGTFRAEVLLKGTPLPPSWNGQIEYVQIV